MGLIPGWPPATESLYTIVPMALVVFLYYQFLGVREHGVGYLKQFTGGLPPSGLNPFLTIFLAGVAGLVFVIELIGHIFRPASLSLRLFGNMTGDHTLLSTTLTLAPIGAPMFAMMLGLLVSTIQALVFSLLTSVYIKLAVSHDH